MAVAEPVLVEAKDETRHYTWRPARVEWEPGAGAITIFGVRDNDLSITIPIGEVAGFEIVMREGISILPHVALGALLADWGTGLGCLLSIILAPVALVDSIIARRTRLPAIKLTQSPGDDMEQRWTVTLRSKKRGQRGRAETREVAHRIADLLRDSGYSGSMPDLSISSFGLAR